MSGPADHRSEDPEVARRTDLSDWNDFRTLVANWQEALEWLRKREAEVMGRVKEEQRKFGEKEARETLVRDWERNIWIDTALDIPEAQQRIVEQVFQNEDATRQIVEQAFQNEDA